MPKDNVKKYLEEHATMDNIKHITNGDEKNLSAEIHQGLLNLGINAIKRVINKNIAATDATFFPLIFVLNTKIIPRTPNDKMGPFLFKTDIKTRSKISIVQ